MRLSSALVKICLVPYVILQTTSQFFFKFRITFQCHKRKLLCTCLGQTWNTLHNGNKRKWKYLRLSSARVKFLQILVIFETTDQSFFKFCIDLQGLVYTFELKFYILSAKGTCYQSTSLVKFYVSSQKSGILHFDGILLSKSCTVSTKKSTE